MSKIGRNDPCPSGAGVKFKKCLARHPELSTASKLAEIWWVCDRWSAPAPSVEELVEELTPASSQPREKLDAFLDLAFREPVESVSWDRILVGFHAQGGPDLPELFRRIAKHIERGSNSLVVAFLSRAANIFGRSHPEMYPEILDATLKLDPALTKMWDLEGIVEWALRRDESEDIERLQERFPEFPSYVVVDDSEEENGIEWGNDTEGEAEEDAGSGGSGPKIPESVVEEVDRIWDEFEKIDEPSSEDISAFVEALLDQPHEANDWHDVFGVVRSRKDIDLFETVRHFSSSLSHSRIRELGFIYWGAAEEAVRRNQPEQLPWIAQQYMRLNAETYDVDGLVHIRDILLGNRYIDEALELMVEFLPVLRKDDGLVSWVVPREEMNVFYLRLGKMIASGAWETDSPDQLQAALVGGLDLSFEDEWVAGLFEGLARKEETSYSRDVFGLPELEDELAHRETVWRKFDVVFAEVARDHWRAGGEHPSLVLIGLWMILRSAEGWARYREQKGKKYSKNLLDYLDPAVIERQVARECADLMGPNVHLARIMVNAHGVMAEWAARKGLLEEKKHERIGKEIKRLERVLA